MTETMSRHVRIDDWLFEVKMVRALRVDSYGKPYDAIANVIVNGKTAFIEGLMLKEQEELSKDDCLSLTRLCQQLGASHMQYERFKNGKQRTEVIDVDRFLRESQFLQLVK